MASISTDGNGNRTIQFVGSDGKRRSIRLGDVPKRMAESVKTRVEHLNAMKRNKLPMDSDTADWVGGIGTQLASKLAAVGLIPARSASGLGEFCLGVLADRRTDGTTKPATVVTLETVTNDLRRHFGEDLNLRDVTEAMAEDFRIHYQTRKPKLANATVSRRLTTVRQIFEVARRRRLIDANPFAEVSARSSLPPERRFYLTPDDFTKLIAACIGDHWRTVLALTRLGGLRCPSEVLSLRWADVNLKAGRMRIRSPKTEHIAGKDARECPVFADLRPFLESARRDGPFVIGGEWGDRQRKVANSHRGWISVNLRGNLKKIIRRAGLKEWPKLFQNMRASCETDLNQIFPTHVVAAWLGHSPKVAVKHYLQVTDANFDKAVQNPVHPVPILSKLDGAQVFTESARTPEPLVIEGENVNHEWARRDSKPGSEPLESPCILRFPCRGGADSGAVPILSETAHADNRLPAILAAFTAGGDPVRAALYAVAVNPQLRKAG